MSAYALLQLSLDQTLSREAMEEASVAAPMVARGDCARLQRELFGVVVRRLDEANARAFQEALRRRGFETELVPDDDLFTLPGAFGVSELRIEGEGIATVDVYGRARAVPWRACVFAAAGWAECERQKTKADLEWVVVGRGRYQRQELRPTVKRERETGLQFRIECFFASDPMRVAWVVEEGRVARLNGQPVRARDAEALGAFLDLLRARMPEGRVNRGITLFGGEREPRYPNLRCFEEEIIWHFHRLRSARLEG